jgi:predicted RNA-binding Zn-ribbon protein involved in translation (DUF1610 family)
MRILCYDVETVPTQAYVWSAWKQNVAASQVQAQGRVVCWAAKWLGAKARDVYFGAEWADEDGEDFMVRLHGLMEEADAVITYNGNKFDEPVVRTEFAKRGLTPPPPHKSIDMYQVVRKQFRLLHNRMDSVAEFLGVEGKTETGGFQLWVDVMNGDPKGQALMEKYNRKDIKVLEDIYEKLLPWIPNHPALNHYGDAEAHSCPNCGSTKLHRRGTHKTKVSTFQRFQCTNCGSWSRSRVADRLAPKPSTVTI